MNLIKWAILITVLLQIWGGQAVATPNTLTLQSRIFKPNGAPLEASAVNFRFTTLSGVGNCVVYVEQFNSVNMTASSGNIIFNLGSGIQNFSGTNSNYSTIFNNLLPLINCQSGSTYSPGSTDRRRIVIQFNDGSAAGWQTLPSVDINSVPYSNYAGDSEKFAGKNVSDFLLSATLPASNCSGSQLLTFNNGSFSCVTAAGLLGSAAVLNAGTSATNLVQLDGAGKIPSALLPTTTVSSSTSLGGDVTGTISATVVSNVGGKTATATAQSVTDTQAATDSNNPSTLVKRDTGGNIAVGNLSATGAAIGGTTSVASSIESASAYANSSTAYTIPDALTNIRRITLTANATITLPTFQEPAGKIWTITVMIKQDSTGSRTLTWAVPAGDSILWDQSATAPAPATSASKVTIYQFTKPSDETTWYGSLVWKQN